MVGYLDSHCGVSELLVLSSVAIRDVAELLTTMVEVSVWEYYARGIVY